MQKLLELVGQHPAISKVTGLASLALFGVYWLIQKYQNSLMYPASANGQRPFNNPMGYRSPKERGIPSEDV
jgi:hypothetical protein